jgi:hypothetical protein
MVTSRASKRWGIRTSKQKLPCGRTPSSGSHRSPSRRLRDLGVSWPDVTTIDVYTANELSKPLVDELLKRSAHNAVTWNYTRPPITDIEVEMDLRGVRREIVLG